MGILLRSTPSKRIVPEYSSRPSMALSKVVLPDPEGPRTTLISPRGKEKEREWRVSLFSFFPKLTDKDSMRSSPMAISYIVEQSRRDEISIPIRVNFVGVGDGLIPNDLWKMGLLEFVDLLDLPVLISGQSIDDVTDPFL